MRVTKDSIQDTAKLWEHGAPDKANYAAIVTYAGAKYGVIFLGNSPAASYFARIADEDQFKRDTLAMIERNAKATAERKADRAAQRARYGMDKAFHANYQPGQILHGSWGYEQTNCEFYQIVERKGNGGKYLVRRMQNAIHTGTSSMSARVIPGEMVGEPIPATTTHCGIKVKGLRANLSPWNGKPEYSSWYG